MSSLAKLRTLPMVGRRTFYIQSRNNAQDQEHCFNPRWQKVKKLQEKFQKDEKCPVPLYLKGGFVDKLLFNATVGLSLIGLGASIYVLMFKTN